MIDWEKLVEENCYQPFDVLAHAIKKAIAEELAKIPSCQDWSQDDAIFHDLLAEVRQRLGVKE